MELSTLQIRIENTKANIEKTKKTLERHQKQADKYAAQLTERGIDFSDMTQARRDLASSSRHDDYWLLCDYDNKLDDIKRNELKLSDLAEKLEQYKAQYKTEAARQDVPRIPALEDFLAKWKVDAADWYRDRVDSYHGYIAQREETCRQIKAKYEPHTFRHRKEIEAEEKAAGVDYHSYQEHIRYHYGADVVALAQEGHRDEPRFEAKLEDALAREVNNKRVDLYYRCTDAVGVITDAAALRVGNNGSLNGWICGENGRAEVRTVLAGGPIQCLHYRVLVLPIREKEALDKKLSRVSSQQKAEQSNHDTRTSAVKEPGR